MTDYYYDLLPEQMTTNSVDEYELVSRGTLKIPLLGHAKAIHLYLIKIDLRSR